MKRVELLKIEDTFAIEGAGVLLLTPDFSVPKNGWKTRTESVTLETQDGTRVEAMADFSLSHFNIRDPHVSMDRRWRVVIGLKDKKKEEVPLGTILLVSQETKDALLSRDQ